MAIHRLSLVFLFTMLLTLMAGCSKEQAREAGKRPVLTEEQKQQPDGGKRPVLTEEQKQQRDARLLEVARRSHPIGETISITGIAEDGMLGPCIVEDLDHLPVLLSGSRSLTITDRDIQRWQKRVLGRKVTATGKLTLELIGSDDQNSQFPRQPLLRMDQCDIVVSDAGQGTEAQAPQRVGGADPRTSGGTP
jgi:hypothetical protein